jgi:acyl-CoA thioesterase
MTIHPLDDATALVQTHPDAWSGTTSDAYWNFAGPFGGYVAALLMRAVLSDPRRLGPPVAQTVNFCGPLAKGAFTITASIARGGKATQHWTLALTQNGDTFATGSIVCANRRTTWAHTIVTPPVVPPADRISRLQPPPQLPWLKAYDFRFVEGGPKFGAPAATPAALGPSKTVLWMRDHPERALDYLSLSALSDCFILRLVQMRGGPMIPMGTVSMTTYVHASEDELTAQGTSPLLGIADAKRFHANFHDQQMEVWGTDGRLLATGVQTVWYKE